MAQTSIHFQPVNRGSEEHNKRKKKLDYVHHELSSQNEYWQSDTQEARLAFVANNAKTKTGRKMQTKATPIREAVVVIDERTDMEALKELSKRLHDRFGIEVFQIAIHRDEGYAKSKDKLKINLHAHLVADWTDHETGKSLKLSRQDMSEMQTIVADVLHMERGHSSDKKHLSAIQYKVEAETKRAVEAEKRAQQAEAKAVGSLVVGSANKLANTLGFGKEAKLLKEVPKQLEAAKEEGRAEGRAETIAEVMTTARLNFGEKSPTPVRIGTSWRNLFNENKQLKNKIDTQSAENEKKTKIVQNMITKDITYDDAANKIKKLQGLLYYKTQNGYAGGSSDINFKNSIFDPLCEREGCHNVQNNEIAIGRRELIAQRIVITIIMFFDSYHLDKIANALRSMAQDFDLSRWKRKQEISAKDIKQENIQKRNKGWHL